MTSRLVRVKAGQGLVGPGGACSPAVRPRAVWVDRDGRPLPAGVERRRGRANRAIELTGGTDHDQVAVTRRRQRRPRTLTDGANVTSADAVPRCRTDGVLCHGCLDLGLKLWGSGQHGGRGLDGLHRGVLVERMGADADVVPTAGHEERRRRRRCQGPALDVPFGGARSRRGPRMSAGVWTEASGSSRSWEFLVELRADGSRMSCWRLDRSRSRSELYERESQSSSSCVISVQGVLASVG